LKIALLNDIHIAGARSDSRVVAQHQGKFFTEIFFPYLEEHNIKDVFILGDVFERRKYVNFKSLKYAFDTLFRPAEEKGIKIHILLGNHDTASRDSNLINSPDLLLTQFSNIIIYDYEKPQEVLFDDLWIGVMPWINDSRESQQAASDFLQATQCPVIFGHFDIVGFEMHAGAYCEVGLSADMFKRFDQVITGHYHNKSSKGNIHYLGVQYDMDWNDYGSSKYFHVFDTTTRELSPIENPNRLFMKLTYHNKLLEGKVNITGKYVKIVVTEKSNAYDFEVCVNQLRAQHPESLIVIDTVVEDIQQVDTAEVRDVPSIITKHVAALNQDDTFKANVSTLLTNIYNEASVT